jgi:hypothetical protein
LDEKKTSMEKDLSKVDCEFDLNGESQRANGWQNDYLSYIMVE